MPTAYVRRVSLKSSLSDAEVATQIYAESTPEMIKASYQKALAG